ncbi:MAG: fibronectin type III domain-containing protein, partial [Pseudomonadota bacterium]
AQAGLDLWLDASVIMDLVSLDAFALPNFTLTMPIVVEDNEINTQASQPCFDFALDVSWSVQVGWCPFCIKAGDLANLFRVQDGAGCSAEAPPRTLAAPTPPLVPPIDRTSLAADGQGRSSLVWGDGSGQIQLQHFNNGVGDIFESLAAGPGASGADIAFFDANRSVLVWSQSSLSEADFMALDGDPADPTDGDFVTAAASRQLVYRVNNGGGWSNTQALTPPFSGDGGVVLASCPATSSVCPSGGEVLAAWVHDAAGNVNLHDLKLRYSFFNGTSWSPVRDVDASSTAKDLQPAPAYLGADPVVFWVRNPSVTDDGSTATFDLSQRRLAYRFLRQLAGTQEPAGLPLGIASPSAQPFGQDSLVLAFSKATEPDAFIGTRRALHTAYATQCFEGVCQFNGSQERKDSLGRRIYVERPQITRNGNNQAVVTFRQIGVDNATADDPTGILTHSGALMQLSFALDPLAQVPTSDPFELSSIGGVNWRVDAIFDAASNSVLTSAVQVDQTAALQALGLPVGEAINGVNERRFGVTNGDLVLVERPMLADYEVLSAQIDRDWIAEGDMAQLTIRYRNNGIDPFGSPTIATFWNGPAGLGLAGPSQTVADPPVGQVQELVMSLPLPKDLSSDDSHTLAITINPFGASDEADGSNNSVELLIGELPSPENVVNVDGDTTGIIVLHWDPVDDERVTGYRIYRQNPDGTVLNVGSSAVSGFADFAAYPGQRYEYFVTSRTLGLVESSPSRLVVARTRSPDRLFSDRFE